MTNESKNAWAPRNLGALINREQHGSRPLLIDCRDPAAPKTWTGADLESQADAIARAVLARGFAPGERIAILSANRAEYLTAYYGIMRAGLVAVPVNVKLPAATIAHVLKDSDARFAFTDAEYAPLAAELDSVNFDEPGFDTFVAGHTNSSPFVATVPEADTVAMFLYTSGSTGMPKGVPLTHAGHLWVIDRRFQPGVDYERERMLVAAPLYHMNALAICKFAAVAGATVVLLPRFTAASYIGAIDEFKCTWLTSVPTMMALVTQERATLEAADLSSVESVRMGSAPVTTELLARVRDVFPTAKVQIGYGTTEAGPVAFGPHPDGLSAPPLALGYAHPEVRLRLTGPDAPDEGVLEMDCPALMPGYHNLPEKTASVMTDDGYYQTGDVMRRDENGFYFFVGRDDDMFVCNGENVYPEEVERLLETHPDIAQSCVVPVDDPVRGQMPVAYVVLRPNASFDEDNLKRFALENGPAYQHPRFVFARDVLPLASTNKIDRRALQEDAPVAVASSGRSSSKR